MIRRERIPIMFVWAMASCGDTTSQAGDDPSFPESSLVSMSDQFLPNGEIEVCWSPMKRSNTTKPWKWSAVSSTDADFVNFRDEMQPLIESQFESIPGSHIDLYGWNICDSPHTGASPGAIRIVVDLSANESAALRFCLERTLDPVHHDAEDMNNCPPGIGYTPDREITIFTTGSPLIHDGSWNFVRAATVHEFGHAIAMTHEEHHRNDSFDNYTMAETCVDQTPAGDQSALTVYDPDSIMNASYCSRDHMLSELDKLGISMIYSSTSTEDPAGALFWMADGTAVSATGAKLTQRWIEGLAGAGAFHRRPTWSVNGGAVRREDTVNIADGEQTVSGSYVDMRDRIHTIAATKVKGDNQMFAAIFTIVN